MPLLIGQPKSAQSVYLWTKNAQFCLLCDDKTDAPFPLCHACELDLPWLGTQCQCCALPLPVDGVCPQCQQKPPAFERVIAPWRYDFPVDSLISRFKHQANWPFGRLLGERLAEHLRQQFAGGLAKPDVLLPVPLGRARLRERGFNQAELLARWLADALQIKSLPQALQRRRDTPSQQGLDAATRKRNLRGAFAFATGFEPRNLHIALVDDVLTTGATAEALAQLLQQNGAKRVDVYCLVRTPKVGGRMP